jgi:hypothetical protein
MHRQRSATALIPCGGWIVFWKLPDMGYGCSAVGGSQHGVTHFFDAWS